MARPPVRSSRRASTTMLFRITIRRPPRGMLRRRMRAPSRLRARRGRPLGKSVRFRSRRALPPFFLFMERHRRRLRRKYPHLTMVQTAKRLGRMWQKLPEGDKEIYKEEAEFRKGRRMRRTRSRSRGRRPRMSSQRRGMRNLMISFTTKAANLRDFLLSYL